MILCKPSKTSKQNQNQQREKIKIATIKQELLYLAMADEFNTTTNWWETSSSSKNRFDSSGSSSSTTNNTSFGWPRSSIDSSASVSGSSVATDNLHMMGLGLSSPSLDWNQALLRGDKPEGSFRSMLQENLNSQSSYRGFSLDQTQFSPHGDGSTSDSTVTCQGLPSSFQMDSSATNLFGNHPSNTIFQGGVGILGSDSQNYHYGAASNNSYGMNMNNTSEVLLPSWSSAAANKVPQFFRTSPPKQQPQHTHLQFSNNAPFWNASAGCSLNDVRSPNFFPSLQTPYAATQSFDEKPKHHVSEVRDTSSTAAKKSSGSEQPASKRSKNDQTASTLPAFKVRKEKMGDRITALQQLVSPFGKTDTASVLSEAIEYIKFLHDQVEVLSTPYMKSGALIPHQQNSEKAKDSEGPKQDLRSRGLCLVPLSSTFPVTHETTVDFWTPTFGGTFR